MRSNRFLYEISQELGRFDANLLGQFRCPTCLRDLPIENFRSADDDNAINEEHIIPDAVGGKQTTFLCKTCNSTFGRKQTRWLVEWISLNEGDAPFPLDPKKQKARITANGRKVNGSMRLGDDGALEFTADRKRSNPVDFDAHWSEPKPPEINIEYRMQVLSNEQSLRVGYLTAAYGLWFKNFGYSFVLQSNLNKVREQILHPEENILDWDYLMEVPAREIEDPSIGLMRLGGDYFPIAVIYDHIVLLPSAQKLPASNTSPGQISKKLMPLGNEIAPRFQHRCVGPAVLICDGQMIIEPDMIANATIPPQHVWVDGWT
ncbi:MULTISPECIES: HNH endonuclease [Phaeobacter]|uniref:HNH endonuclease n=1 Tax=Phaeobacter TaxID=302485 RepID=UPI003A85D241